MILCRKIIWWVVCSWKFYCEWSGKRRWKQRAELLQMKKKKLKIETYSFGERKCVKWDRDTEEQRLKVKISIRNSYLGD